MDLDLQPTSTRAHTALLQKSKEGLSDLLLQPESPTTRIDYIKAQPDANHSSPHGSMFELDTGRLSRTGQAFQPIITTTACPFIRGLRGDALPAYEKVVRLVLKDVGSFGLKNNIRPISLHEVIRKVWTTIIAKRIHLVWHEHDTG
jgi:hypothetical protein